MTEYKVGEKVLHEGRKMISVKQTDGTVRLEVDTTPAHRNADPLEKVIERTVKGYAKSLGYYVRKFNSEGRRSVPDALFINPYGYVFFVEFKRLGKKITQAQALEHNAIKKTGVHVYVIDNIDKGKSVIEQMVDFDND